MELVYPKDPKDINFNKLNPLPTRLGTASACYLIAIAKKNKDLYVLFTNESKDQIWIEKASIFLTPMTHLVAEMLERIDSDEEFNMAHQYFLKKGILE